MLIINVVAKNDSHVWINMLVQVDTYLFLFEFARGKLTSKKRCRVIIEILAR